MLGPVTIRRRMVEEKRTAGREKPGPKPSPHHHPSVWACCRTVRRPEGRSVSGPSDLHRCRRTTVRAATGERSAPPRRSTQSSDGLDLNPQRGHGATRGRGRGDVRRSERSVTEEVRRPASISLCLRASEGFARPESVPRHACSLPVGPHALYILHRVKTKKK